MDKAFLKQGWVLGILLGVLYGILLRVLFELGKYFPGALSFTFVFGAPVVIGAISVYFSGSDKKISLAHKILFPWLSVLAFMLTCLLVALEGFICIVLLSPIFLLLASVGGLIGGYIFNSALASAKDTLKAIAILPLLMAVGETFIKEPDIIQVVDSRVVVNAPAEKIWSNIKSIADIQPSEFSPSFMYLIGVPYPELGQFNESKNIRLSRWEKGISFEEKIVEHVDNNYMRWVYNFKPGDIPAEALDQHVTIGGKYFDVVDTVYETKPLSTSQTELHLSIRYRVSTNLNWYANLWAKYLVGDFENQILNVYKNRSEK